MKLTGLRLHIIRREGFPSVMNLLLEPSGILTESLTQTLIAFSPQEAYAGITLLAIASDSYLAEEELEAIDFHLRRMHLFQHFHPETMQKMFQKLFKILQKDGEEILLASARETLPIELREAAFATASDLVFADGMISRAESSFLTQLYQALEIPASTATNILNVMQLKYQG
jgi:tellurite resistance protein